MNSAESPDCPTWPGDAGARRLLAHVVAACAAREPDDFPARLEAGLRAALESFAAEPELAAELTLDPLMGDDENALDALRVWLARFGELLSDAVDDDPRTTTSRLSFLAAFLVGGVRFQIARLVLKGEVAELPRLLPGLLETLLAFYFEPGEPRRLAQAALAGR